MRQMPGIIWNAADKHSGPMRVSISRCERVAVYVVEWSRSEKWTNFRIEENFTPFTTTSIIRGQYGIIQLSAGATSISLQQCLAAVRPAGTLFASVRHQPFLPESVYERVDQHNRTSLAFARSRQLMRNMASSPKNFTSVANQALRVKTILEAAARRIRENRLSPLSESCQIGKRALTLTGVRERAAKHGYKYKSARQRLSCLFILQVQSFDLLSTLTT
ncbi:hypothetical protein BDQ94DRAFT_163958 [Aspergillus welwitschiae]|uniref:Uncharacterized protein n=1 Tax=Aspergillus welwitschiae TaxID=1341132 RepID=A0A3F3PJB9_9EURO|nr:hypothetical protein BDQ94DRAFT_163958 [Aspergillus welwitschiae]RDH27044.1 hypothetical protein BDQ94DRAFT_163958 [Aspergillus welwitschiae]